MAISFRLNVVRSLSFPSNQLRAVTRCSKPLCKKWWNSGTTSMQNTGLAASVAFPMFASTAVAKKGCLKVVTFGEPPSTPPALIKGGTQSPTISASRRKREQKILQTVPRSQDLETANTILPDPAIPQTLAHIDDTAAHLDSTSDLTVKGMVLFLGFLAILITAVAVLVHFHLLSGFLVVFARIGLAISAILLIVAIFRRAGFKPALLMLGASF